MNDVVLFCANCAYHSCEQATSLGQSVIWCDARLPIKIRNMDAVSTRLPADE